MGFVDKAITAHLRSGQHTGFVPMSAKVADLTHADTNKHQISLASMGLPHTAVCLLLGGEKIAGAGNLRAYPAEGAVYIQISALQTEMHAIGIINEQLEYSLSNAGDDFDLYCFGYWTAGVVLG